jgi:hypothetical protein
VPVTILPSRSEGPQGRAEGRDSDASVGSDRSKEELIAILVRSFTPSLALKAAALLRQVAATLCPIRWVQHGIPPMLDDSPYFSHQTEKSV